ncbi:MAG: hypothetical protein JNM70_12590, partial [Anaerolineae bacterium]|nr:hypothetical protein [Anaerolineae bacterium]
MTDRVSSRSWIALALLALTLITAFHRLFLGEVFFWGLPALQFYPWQEYAFDLLRDGQLPLWNLYNGAGAPLLANYQSALLYPFNWPGIVLPLAWWMSVLAVLHLFIAGWGIWMLGRRLGLPVVGRGLSAFAFGMSGYLVARLGTYPIIWAAAWLPWMIWAAMRVLEQPSRRRAALFSLIVVAQLLAGHAQTAWYSLLLVAASVGWWAATHRPTAWRSLGIIVLGLTLAAVIAALQLLPTAELLMQSQRSDGVDFLTAMNFSYTLPRSLNLIAPNVFGNPGAGTYITPEGAFFEDAVYVGFVPLMSAVVALGVWFWRRLWRREMPGFLDSVPLWFVIVIVGFIFALGINTPIFPFLYEHVPTFSMFQAPVRWHLWTVFGLSMLAGIGAGMWGRGFRVFFATRLAVAGALGVVVLTLVAPWFLPSDMQSLEGVQTILGSLTGLGILGALAGVLTLLQPESASHPRYPVWMIAVWLVAAGDMGYAAQGLNLTVPASFFDQSVVERANEGRLYWPRDVEHDEKYFRFLRFDDYRVAVDQQVEFRASLLPNLNLIDRVALFNNFDPLLIGWHKAYINLIEDTPSRRDTLLQAAGVNRVMDRPGSPTPLDAYSGQAWFVQSACWNPDDEAIRAALVNPSWNPLTQVHLIGNGDCPPADSAPSRVVVSLAREADQVEATLE